MSGVEERFDEFTRFKGLVKRMAGIRKRHLKCLLQCPWCGLLGSMLLFWDFASMRICETCSFEPRSGDHTVACGSRAQ